MNTADCSALFPQIGRTFEVSISIQKMRAMPYFKHIQSFQIIAAQEKECIASNLIKKAKTIKIKKGTVLYTYGADADQAYFLLKGTVELLTKKTSKQRLDNYPNHTLYSTQQKLNYLQQKFNINNEKGQILISEFYQEKITFKFLPFTTIYGEGYFGISQLLKSGYRPFTAVAISDSQLIVIQKQVFIQNLRQLEQKRQNFILQRIFSFFSQSQVEQIKGKMSQIFPTSQIKLLQNEDFLYRQSHTAKYVYFLIQGEIQMRKKVVLQIPKQFVKHQIKNNPKRQINTKVSKIGSGNFIGQCEVLLHKKQRQFSAVSSSNKSIIIQIDPTIFYKAISQNSRTQRDLTFSAKRKMYLWFESFEKQNKKLRNNFLGQFEEFETKKKQKMLNDFLNDEVGIKSQFYQIFTSDGLFYRDTFQKLEGFDFNSPNQPQKRAAIKRHKGVAPGEDPVPVTNPHLHQYDLQTEEKLLLSQNINLNQDSHNSLRQYQSLNGQNLKKTKDNFAKTSSSNMFKKSQALKKTKSYVNKFRQIQKDQQVYKKVLIKNGIFPIEKRIDHSNSIKAIVNHNFDEVVKKCISRKNPAIKRVDQGKRQILIKQTYEKITNTLKNKSISVSQFTNYLSPCKGTDEMRKRMQSLCRNTRNQQGQTFNKNFISIQGLQDCIGVNQKPKSSDIKLRGRQDLTNNDIRNSQLRGSNKSMGKMAATNPSSFYPKKQRIVLLNHMMKPIIYASTEI